LRREALTRDKKTREETMKKRMHAVLTGDLVDSSKLAGEQSTMAMQWLRDAVKKFESLYPESIAGKLDTFRHDSWQMLMKKPALSFCAAVYLRASPKLHSGKKTKYDSRISIGPAFTISGQNPDAMDRARLTCKAQREAHAAFFLLGHVAIPLLDCVVTDWTPNESHAVHGTLERLSQEKIATVLSRNPRTG
jgi:hypothetical protein